MPTAINVLAVVKGRERYIFLYHDQHAVEAHDTAWRWARYPDLSFTEEDACEVSRRLSERQLAKIAETRPKA